MVALDMIRQWWAYLSYCFFSDYSDAVCRGWWSAVVIGTFLIAGVIVLAVGRSILREHLEFRRNRMRLAARAFVDEEAIQASSWKGDSLKGNPDELSAEELAEKIRVALEARKREQAEIKPVAGKTAS